MNPRVQRLQRAATFLQQIRTLCLFGIPGLVSLVWMLRVSESFLINRSAIFSGVFVFVATFLPVAIVHTVAAAIVERRLADAERDARVPRAIARR